MGKEIFSFQKCSTSVRTKQPCHRCAGQILSANGMLWSWQSRLQAFPSVGYGLGVRDQESEGNRERDKMREKW